MHRALDPLRRLIPAVCALLIAPFLLVSQTPAHAGGRSFQATYFATDVASAGYGGMKGVGTGSLSLSGVTGGSVSHAWLFWHGPAFAEITAADATNTVSFAGESIVGSIMGQSGDNCWDGLESRTYLADVTPMVSGSGVFALAGFGTPMLPINGASLVVFFQDGDRTNDRDVVFFVGNDSNDRNRFDPEGFGLGFEDVTYGTGPAALEVHVSDGQTPSDGALTLNDATLQPEGAIFSGTSVPRGSGGAPNGALWDIVSFDIAPHLVSGETSTVLFRSEMHLDCLSLVGALLALPVGAAPQNAAAEAIGVRATLGPLVTQRGHAAARTGETSEESLGMQQTAAGGARLVHGIATAPSDGFVARPTATGTASDINISNGLITARLVRGVAQITGSPGGEVTASSTGSSIEQLVIAGQSVVVPVAPNTIIEIPGVGRLVLREEQLTQGAAFAAFRVTMLHFTSTDGTVEVEIGSAQASIGRGAPSL